MIERRSLVSREIRHWQSQRIPMWEKITLGVFILVISLCSYGIYLVDQREYPNTEAHAVVKVLIGTGCPTGRGPGAQVVTDTWSDAALDGCKEIEAHDFIESK